jgi:hypothetical protein
LLKNVLFYIRFWRGILHGEMLEFLVVEIKLFVKCLLDFFIKLKYIDL